MTQVNNTTAAGGRFFHKPLPPPIPSRGESLLSQDFPLEEELTQSLTSTKKYLDIMSAVSHSEELDETNGKETIVQETPNKIPDLEATFPSNPVTYSVINNSDQEEKKESIMVSNTLETLTESPTKSASQLLMAQKVNLFDNILSKKSSSLPDFGALDSHKSNLSLDLDSDTSATSDTVTDYFFVRNINTVNIDDLVQSKFGKCQMLDHDLIFNENLKKIRNRFKPIYESLSDNDALYNGNIIDNFSSYSLGNVEFEKIMSSFATNIQEYCEYELKYLHDFFKTECPAINQSLPLIISLKSLTIDELKCTVNVLKKVLTLSSYTHPEKILVSQSLALSDLYNYLFFDNPTRNQAEMNKALIRKRSDSNGSDTSTESPRSSSPSLLSKFFSRNKKKSFSKSPLVQVDKDVMYLQIYLVIFEFSESDIVEIPQGYEHNVYRTAIGVGNWILEWKENSLVIPSRKTPFHLNHNYHCIPLRRVEGDLNVEKLICKLSNMCCLWNGNYVYDLTRCNHQHFVRDVLEMLDQESISTKIGLFEQPSDQSTKLSTSLNDNISVGSQSSTSSTPSIKIGGNSEFGISVDRFLQYIQRNGYAPLTFYINDHVKEVLYGKKLSQMKKSRSSPSTSPHKSPSQLNTSLNSYENSPVLIKPPQPISLSCWNGYFNRNEELDEYNEKEYITFKEHRELDSLYFQIKNAFGSTEYFKTHPEGKWDYWLLKLLDRGFWTRITNSQANINRDQKDYPLTKLNARVTLHKESLEKLMEQKHVNIVIKTNLMFHEKEECNCPFNLDTMSTLEMDMTTKLPDTTFLGDYEPIIPHKRSWIVTSNNNNVVL